MTVTAPARPTLLSSTEFCRRAGITYRQLDWWVRHGALVPAVAANGSGTQRKLHESDVAFANALGRVLSWVSTGPRPSLGPIAAAVRESLALGCPVEPIPGLEIDAARLASP